MWNGTLTLWPSTIQPMLLKCPSVDIVLDSDYGDISKEATRNYWAEHIAQGHVVGFLAGPPCNTWSCARHHVLAQAQGPRVIRTPTEPWGRDSLSLRELQQVCLGRLLLGFAFQCIALLASHSGTGFVEHPKDPDEADKVSIWRLPLLHAILELPGLRLVHLAQGLFGSPSAKPTTLLVLGMPQLEKELHANRVTVELPVGASVGRSSSGHLLTAPLIEYTPSMCKAIASALCSDIISTECDDSAVPAE